MPGTPSDLPHGTRVGAGWPVCAAAALAVTMATIARPAVGDAAAATLSAAPAIVADALPDMTKERLSRALAYEHGEGMPQDQRLAAAMYCDVAISGNAEAAYRLGWMYANGRGVAHDDGTAAALFQLAADEGHAYARTMLERLRDARGLLPDCMRPLVPPPAPDTPVVADFDDGPDPFADLPPYKQKIADLVNKVAPRYGIEPRLALAVIAVESNFDALARSVKDARGLMQLVPGTAARFNVRNSYDMAENVRGGLAYLRWLLSYYRGEVTLAAAAYNAGEGAVDRYRGVPPFPETRDYVRRVLRLFRSAHHPYDPNIVEPSVIAADVDAGRK